MKFFILLTIVTTQSFASDLLLNRQRMSGFVPPEYAFSKVCHIFTDGKVEITSILGGNPQVVTTTQISKRDVLLIDVFLEVAARGIVDSLPVMCDAGTDIINGYRKKKKIVLDENHDCSSHLLNRSRTVPVLKEWAQVYCGF